MLLLVSAIIGAGVTVVVIWPHGALVALAAAPFGGSLIAVLAALLVDVLRRAEAERGHRHSAENPAGSVRVGSPPAQAGHQDSEPGPHRSPSLSI